ncbi:DUF1501 domain-containing protein [Gimesia maris]|uniref:DUF1501 domain-containing protein n=1 Tax=Gimesia maris TaxID=122 RepID=A0ABX5YS22_9PLAN|nr:DUF1501 domain-containing protein [Gimesia maris]EDL62033.1 hypothetical protein PM8797T_22278 [Gimesia maris DSM 8797]QEG18423.1 hypothetical protein GmarT_43110 [Gimesia maris]QGQ28599.1 DUF1501 domain-containing protein [Gimesia maris]
MLKILGSQKSKFCDQITRRNFLQIGGLALGGMSLPQILQAENSSNQRKTHKGIIMIFLPGGPPHQDMWDIKVDAPSEIRGEFNAIQTNVPGVEIGDQFPRMAQMADKFAFIRSMVGSDGRHDAFQCLTGQRFGNQPLGGWPSLGSVLSKKYGPVDPSIPPFLGLSPKMGHMEWARAGDPGFLGLAHAPFRPNGEGMADMTLNGITLDRLDNRKKVLSSLDQFRSKVDASGMMEGLDSFNQQAFGILTSSKLADALDLSKEDQSLRDRYGRGTSKLRADGGPKLLDDFLTARRLIEAGARCVTLAFSRWDWHGGNFKRGREDMPMLDQGVTALIEDLENRDMLDDVTVVVWGEFGRTPKINANSGRDHWPRVSTAVVAGGGMKTGQIIGSTNRLGEYAEDRPVHFQEVFATLYHNLGINVETATVDDLQGRPRYLVDTNKYKVMPELI